MLVGPVPKLRRDHQDSFSEILAQPEGNERGKRTAERTTEQTVAWTVANAPNLFRTYLKSHSENITTISLSKLFGCDML